MKELTEADIRLVLSEHDEDLEISFFAADNNELNVLICGYLDVLKTGDIELIEKKNIFGVGADAVFYFYESDGWKVVSELNGVAQIMSELCGNNRVYVVSIKDFNKVVV